MHAMIAEDSVLLREGVARLLTEAGIDVVATSHDPQVLLPMMADDPPDVVILDIRLPPTHTDEGIRAALTIRADHPDVGVLVLSQYVEVGLAMRLLEHAADHVGYLLKDRISDVADFVDAVRRVAAGGSAIDPLIVSALIAKRRLRDPLERLTPREREVLVLMAEGRSNQGIAERMVITVRAVERYVSSVFTKLELPRTGAESKRVLATLLYLRDES
jgi:DNA-binding NarL/FixJ family response regulator